MSWGHVEHPRKVFKVGDKLNVLIKEINGSKVALSLKFEDQNPWRDAADKYAIALILREIFLSASLKSTIFAVTSSPMRSTSEGFSTRDVSQWKVLEEKAVPELISRFGRSLKIWSYFSPDKCLPLPLQLPVYPGR